MNKGFWNSHTVMDPSDLESIFSNDDMLKFNDVSIVEALREDRVLDFSKVKDALSFLHPREADYLELYFFRRMKQAAIADLFGISQPTVCYRLKRAAFRLKYVLTLPNYDKDLIEEDLKSVIKDPTDVFIMIKMVETTCQSSVARSLEASQGYVRHRFFRTLKLLQNTDGMDNYVDLFKHVSEHLNIMKQIQRSAWNDPMIYVVS
jgi:predicted transcriptional regulator